MDASQCERLEAYLRQALAYAKAKGLRPVFRHGDCIGADDQAGRMAYWLGFFVITHPSTFEKKRAYSPAFEVRQPKPPLDRNRDIVDLSHYMVATPKEDAETVRSGTWATIRYTRKQQKYIEIIYP